MSVKSENHRTRTRQAFGAARSHEPWTKNENMLKNATGWYFVIPGTGMIVSGRGREDEARARTYAYGVGW